MSHVMQHGAGPFSGTYIPTMAGWVQANTYYNNVPFNSKPPPVPPGVNPQTWMSGQWQANPMFRPQPGMMQGQSMWAPHPGWAAVAQGQNGFNPHKRTANPDPSYWATKLSDNSLQLHDMHIKDPVPTTERHVKEQNGVPHTPWVWVPKELMSSEEANKSLNSDPASQGNHPQPQQTDKTLPAPPSRDHSRASSSSQRDAFNSQQYPSSSHSRSLQHASTAAQPTSAPAVSSYSSYHQQAQQSQPQPQTQQQHHHQQTPQKQQQQAQQHRSPDAQRVAERHSSVPPPPQDTSGHARQRSYESSARPSTESQFRDYRTPTTSASASASASAAAAARERERERERTASGDRDQRESNRANEAYSESRELHLTFSPKIVRTPRHYSSGSRPSSHEESKDAGARTPPLGSIYAPASNAPSRSNSLSVRRQPTMPATTPSSVRTPASTTSTSLGLLMFTEEPQAMLSPLVVGSTPPMDPKPSPGRDSQSGPRDRNAGSSHTLSIQERPGYAVAFSGGGEREGKTYPRTPRPRAGSRLSTDEYERGGDRDRSANVTPQPPTRTPPTRTPPSRTSPSTFDTRPSPESGSYHARQISRSHTYPSVTPNVPPPVIPSPPSTSPRYGSLTQHHSFSSSHHHSSNSPHQHQSSRDYSSNSNQSSQAQQYPPSSYSSSSYPRTSPNANSSRSRATSPLRRNPLPRPPAVSSYTETLSRNGVTSASAAAAVQQSSSYQPRRTVRSGYWNRRGDHLYVTESGERFIVYAPRHLANPDDLKQYPAPTEGFVDHRGDVVKYDPKVPELLDSLPLHGDLPKRPYSSFVQYIDV